MTKHLPGLVLAALLTFTAVSAARAAEPGAVLERNLYKTVTYEVLTNGYDAVMYGLVLGGSAANAPLFVGMNATLAAVSYYAHETAWDLGFDDPEPFGGWSLAVRTASYRVVSSSKTYALALLFTGDPVAAAGFAVVGAIGDVTVYLLNDLAWNRYWPITAEPAPPSILVSG